MGKADTQASGLQDSPTEAGTVTAELSPWKTPNGATIFVALLFDPTVNRCSRLLSSITHTTYGWFCLHRGAKYATIAQALHVQGC